MRQRSAVATLSFTLVGDLQGTLCLEEKLMVMKGRSKNILNRRSEMFSKCRHAI